MLKELHLFEVKDGGTSASRGFNYQYLKTLLVWVESYINKTDLEIFCETDDDIKQIDISKNYIEFNQIKCYSDNISLSSKEIKKSIYNFFINYCKNIDLNTKFFFETNTSINHNDLILNDWFLFQDNIDERLLLKCIPLVEKILIDEINIREKKEIDKINKRLNVLLKKTFITKHYEQLNEQKIANIKNEKILLEENINHNKSIIKNNLIDFVKRVGWVFSDIDPEKAIINLREEILEKIEVINNISISGEFIFDRLISNILSKSSQKDFNNRRLDRDLLEFILDETKQDIESRPILKHIKNIESLDNLKIFKGFENKRAEYFYTKGNKNLYNKKYQIAHKNFNKSILSLNKNMAQVLTDIGVNYCYQGNMSNGINEFEKAIKLNPNNYLIRRNLGLSYFKIKNYNKSIDELKISLTLKSDDITIDMLAMSYYEQAIIFSNNQNYQESLNIFEKMAKLIPDDENTLTNVGVSHIALGNYQKAIEILEAVTSKNPNNFIAKFNLASACLRKNEYKTSLKYYHQLLEEKSNYKNLNYNIGLTYEKLYEFDNAIKYLKKEIEFYPDSSDTYKNLGIIYTKINDHNNAIFSIKKAISLKPNDSINHRNLGVIYSDIAEYKEAIKSLKEAIRLKPESSQHYNEIGCVYFKNENLDEAEESFIKSYNLNNQCYMALYNLGLLYMEKDQNFKAKEYLLRALEIEPDYVPIFYNLSCIYSLENNTEESLKNLKKSILLDSKYKQLAKDDEGFKNLRNDIRFIKLTTEENNGII